MEQFTTIMDLTGLTLEHRHVVGVIQSFLSCDSKNYPERMGCLCVINAPSVFPLIWSLIKGWMDPVTMAKIHILGSDYQELLKSIIDEDVLPEEYGGKNKNFSARDTSAERLKALQEQLVPLDQEFKIRAGKIHVVSVLIKANQRARWHFIGDSDVDYSVTFASNGTAVPIERHDPISGEVRVFAVKRVPSTAFGFSGSFHAKESGALYIKLDNTFSYFSTLHVKFGLSIEEVDLAREIKQAEELVCSIAPGAKWIFHPELVSDFPANFPQELPVSDETKAQ